MDLEMGLKVSQRKGLGEFSSTHLLISKDRASPLFVTKENDSMFILTVNLRGYSKEQINIEISDDGSRIVIKGEKPVQQTIMVGGKTCKKETEICGFRRIFKVPDGVILDKIKAKFNQDESLLTISMKKAIKGIKGVGIEEVRGEEEEDRGTLQVQETERQTSKQKLSADLDAKNAKKDAKNFPQVLPHEADKGQENENLSYEKNETTQRSSKRAFVVQENLHSDASSHEHSIQESEAKNEQSTQRDDDPRKSTKSCTPIIAGSVLLVSLIVFAIQFIRTKDKSLKKKQ